MHFVFVCSKTSTKCYFVFVLSVRTDLTEDGAWSRLLVAHATPKDSGNYSCALADVAAATVTVHVLNGRSSINVEFAANRY